ncbi:hypothetical protein F4703DRAFT_1025346 [Phycomyces blakesleeanus]
MLETSQENTAKQGQDASHKAASTSIINPQSNDPGASSTSKSRQQLPETEKVSEEDKTEIKPVAENKADLLSSESAGKKKRHRKKKPKKDRKEKQEENPAGQEAPKPTLEVPLQNIISDNTRKEIKAKKPKEKTTDSKNEEKIKSGGDPKGNSDLKGNSAPKSDIDPKSDSDLKSDGDPKSKKKLRKKNRQKNKPSSESTVEKDNVPKLDAPSKQDTGTDLRDSEEKETSNQDDSKQQGGTDAEALSKRTKKSNNVNKNDVVESEKNLKKVTPVKENQEQSKTKSDETIIAKSLEKKTKKRNKKKKVDKVIDNKSNSTSTSTSTSTKSIEQPSQFPRVNFPSQVVSSSTLPVEVSVYSNPHDKEWNLERPDPTAAIQEDDHDSIFGHIHFSPAPNSFKEGSRLNCGSTERGSRDRVIMTEFLRQPKNRVPKEMKLQQQRPKHQNVQ